MSEIDHIWSDDYLVPLERQLWIAVMAAQRNFRPSLVSAEQLEASRNAVWDVDLARIREREMKTKHDLKARLEEFVYLSGHSRIHLGMTSADIVENTYLIRQRRSIEALGEPVLSQCRTWLFFQPFRGIRGPVGSDVDQVGLLGGVEAALDLSRAIAATFGFNSVINAVGQCMPRSFDLELATRLAPLVEGAEGRAIMNGLVTMIAGQEVWLEGDVATSCVRRYAWPMIFRTVEHYAKRDTTEREIDAEAE